jgi:prevent-host-death family protein
MHKKISAIKARQNLGELLEEVYYKNDHFVITRREKAMAVVIPLEEYEQFLKQREGDFSVIDEIRALHRSKSPEDVERDVSVAVKRLRASKRAKASHAKGRP